MKNQHISILQYDINILVMRVLVRYFFIPAFCLFIEGMCFAQSPISKPGKKDPLQDSVEKYQNRKEFERVIPFAEQWVEKLKKETKTEYGAALNAWGNALNQTGKNEEAEPILLQGLEIRKKALGESHPDVAHSLNNLGVLFQDLGNYPKAEPFFLQTLEIRKKALRENHPEVASSLQNLGALYIDMGNYPKAELYFLQAFEIRKKVQGPEHLDVALSLSDLANAYYYMGDFAKAEPYFLQALEIKKKALGENHLEVAVTINNLGALYMAMGNFPKAEPYNLQALEIYKKALGENHPHLANSLNILGAFYGELGNYPKAEPYFLRALKIRKNALGENHPAVAGSINNLGALYSLMGLYPKAEPYYLQALEIQNKTLGENHPVVANSIENLGKLCQNMGKYAKAGSYYFQALELQKKTLGENHFQAANSLANLGSLNQLIGNYKTAEGYYLESLGIFKKALGENHPSAALSIIYLGNLHFFQGHLEKAEIRFLEGNAKKLGMIQRYFPFMSDQEKTQFFENNLLASQEKFKSFCISRYASKTGIAGDLYTNQLATKGLLLNSSAKWKHRIKTSGDKKLFNLFNNWEASQNELNKLLQSSDSTERAGIDSVEKKTEKMEKELSLRSENFAKLADKKLVTWKEVQKTLKPGEAAIEIVRVKKFGIEKTITDTSDPKKPTYKVKGLTDTIYYAALIVKPESVYPEMVLLKNGNELEGKHLNFYQNSISKQIKDNQSYNKFWEKIGAKLGTSTRVYFSPDGVFHHINLNTLFNPKTKKYLLEEKDIRMVTATKDLVNPSPVEEENKLAELVGFPNYYAGGPTASVSTSDRKSPQMTYGLRLETMGTLAELPGTKEEVDKIAKVLENKGWEVKNHTQENALEATIKESYKPRVLHIATHGFFQPDGTKGSNPLLRSGLMLTGAGSTLKGEKNESGEDGILTAYEAMNLNLDNTDLVVLSACETGLGEIKNGEGVYGLQRAFKVAGARSLIMSLWKVDDEATQELMVGFYKNWLSGSSKRVAFLKAQKELKVKYPNPYYWGAFVLVGE